MRISRDKYFKDMAKALLKGYFAGLKEGKKSQGKSLGTAYYKKRCALT